MIKLVAFDWNGTIFSDTSAVHEGVNEVLKLFKRGPTTLNNFQKHFDIPAIKTYLGLGITEEELNNKSSIVTQTFHTYYEKRASKIRTRENARNLFDWLLKNDIASVIFSNHIDTQIKKQLTRLKIEKYFSEVLANEHIGASIKGRYKKDKLKTFIDNNRFKFKETLIIGDTLEEIEIGKELGVLTVAITHGNCSVARLKVAKPDYLIYNLKEIIAIVKKN